MLNTWSWTEQSMSLLGLLRQSGSLCCPKGHVVMVNTVQSRRTCRWLRPQGLHLLFLELYNIVVFTALILHVSLTGLCTKPYSSQGALQAVSIFQGSVARRMCQAKFLVCYPTPAFLFCFVITSAKASVA